MKDFSSYTKAVKDLKNRKSYIRIGRLDLSSMEVKVFSDASYGNMEGGGSQMGYIVFICDKFGNSIPITWGSKKTRRVARSTLTAETLAASEAVDSAQVVKKGAEEVLGRHLPPIKMYVDNKSLADAAKTTNVPTEKRLRIDLAALREMLDRKRFLLRY